MDEVEKIVEEKAKAKVEGQEKAIVEIVQDRGDVESLQGEFLKKQVEEGKSLSDITSDFAKAKATSDIMKNENGEYDKLHKELASEQKETLKESFKQDKVIKQAETLSAKQKKAEAFYISFRPILEFDFSALIHKPLKKGEEEREPKTYKDRSYGIPLMVLMLSLFVVPYCLFSIVLALCNGINAVFEAIATFGKVARVIATTLFIVVLMGLIIYCALLGIDALFGTTIIESIKF
jgi:hypothetical protein